MTDTASLLTAMEQEWYKARAGTYVAVTNRSSLLGQLVQIYNASWQTMFTGTALADIRQRVHTVVISIALLKTTPPPPVCLIS